jgi:hypothetical protein
VYSPDALKANAFKLSRWTLTAGLSKDASTFSGQGLSNGIQPGLLADYRVTDCYGLTVGAVNKAFFGGLSVRLGCGKK